MLLWEMQNHSPTCYHIGNDTLSHKGSVTGFLETSIVNKLHALPQFCMIITALDYAFWHYQTQMWNIRWLGWDSTNSTKSGVPFSGELQILFSSHVSRASRGSPSSCMQLTLGRCLIGALSLSDLEISIIYCLRPPNPAEQLSTFLILLGWGVPVKLMGLLMCLELPP